jgi:dynein heavy chain
MDEDAISRNPTLVKQLTEAVQSWAETIKETMDRAAKSEKTRTHDTASGETIYWSNRSALFNTLYQQLNKQTVRRILNVLSAGERNENGALEEYNAQFHDFSIAYAKAKDFVKFLMTLDRQFRNLSQGTLKNIEETLPSLLNGLKLIWTISRHISQKEEEFEHILEGISNEICSKVRMEIDIKKIFNEKPIENALSRIEQAIIVLEQWHSQYNKTKIEIESTGSTPRWEFSNSKLIF